MAFSGHAGTDRRGGTVPPTYVPARRVELAAIRPSVLVALAIAILIPVAVAVWALLQLGGSNSAR